MRSVFCRVALLAATITSLGVGLSSAQLLNKSIDIGRNRIGSSTFNGAGESYTVIGGGNDTWDNTDELHYRYTEVCGDFDVKVRVESLTANATWSKAGIMVRESLAEDSRMLFERVTPAAVAACAGGAGANDARLAYRTGEHVWDASANGDRFNDEINDGRHEDGDGSPNYPNAWLRLTRVGSVFTGYRSADGINWVVQGTQDTAAGPWVAAGRDGATGTVDPSHGPNVRVPLPSKILLGLSCSRHSGNVPC